LAKTSSCFPDYAKCGYQTQLQKKSKLNSKVAATNWSPSAFNWEEQIGCPTNKKQFNTPLASKSRMGFHINDGLILGPLFGKAPTLELYPTLESPRVVAFPK